MIKGSRNLKFRTRTYVPKPCLRMTFTESPGGCRKPENNKIQFLFKISSEKLSNFGISNNEQSVLKLECLSQVASLRQSVLRGCLARVSCALSTLFMNNEPASVMKIYRNIVFTITFILLGSLVKFIPVPSMIYLSGNRASVCLQ